MKRPFLSKNIIDFLHCQWSIRSVRWPHNPWWIFAKYSSNVVCIPTVEKRWQGMNERNAGKSSISYRCGKQSIMIHLLRLRSSNCVAVPINLQSISMKSRRSSKTVLTILLVQWNMLIFDNLELSIHRIFWLHSLSVMIRRIWSFSPNTLTDSKHYFICYIKQVSIWHWLVHRR